MKIRQFSLLVLMIMLIFSACQETQVKDYTIEYRDESAFSLEDYESASGYEGDVVPDMESAIRIAVAAFKCGNDPFLESYREKDYIPYGVEYNSEQRFWVVCFLPREVVYNEDLFMTSDLCVVIRQDNGQIMNILTR